MDWPPSAAFTAFADAWPRATETEIGAALCATGVGRTLTKGSELRPTNASAKKLEERYITNKR